MINGKFLFNDLMQLFLVKPKYSFGTLNIFNRIKINTPIIVKR